MVALAPLAIAHPVYFSEGHATDGALPYGATVLRFIDVAEDVWFRVRILDAVTGEAVVDKTFRGTDTFVDHSEEPLIPYEGESADSTVSFEIEGFQMGATVVAAGTFERYMLVVYPDVA